MKTRYVLVATIGLLFAVYYIQMSLNMLVVDFHRDIVERVAANPFRYRILGPYLISMFGSSDIQIATGYAVAHLIAFPLMFMALFRWLRVWLSESSALLGVCLVAAYAPLFMQVWVASIYSAIEVIVLATALTVLALHPRRWEWVFVLLVVVGTLNRETALLLPLAYAAVYVTEWRTRGYWLRGALFGGVWAAAFVGLRVWLGPAPEAVDPAFAWALNTGNVSNATHRSVNGILNNLLFLPIWLLYLSNWRYAPAPLKRLALPALVYAGMFLVFGVWDEVRLLLPLLVLTLPVALRGLFESAPAMQRAT